VLHEDVGQPDLKLGQLGQVLQQLARDDVAAARIGRQLDRLLQPAGRRGRGTAGVAR
jgi:hypothetical protein